MTELRGGREDAAVERGRKGGSLRAKLEGGVKRSCKDSHGTSTDPVSMCDGKVDGEDGPGRTHTWGLLHVPSEERRPGVGHALPPNDRPHLGASNEPIDSPRTS